MAMATAMGGLRGLRQALGRARGLASSAEAAPLHQSVVNEARRPAPAMLNVRALPAPHHHWEHPPPPHGRARARPGPRAPARRELLRAPARPPRARPPRGGRARGEAGGRERRSKGAGGERAQPSVQPPVGAGRSMNISRAGRGGFLDLRSGVITPRRNALPAPPDSRSSASACGCMSTALRSAPCWGGAVDRRSPRARVPPRARAPPRPPAPAPPEAGGKGREGGGVIGRLTPPGRRPALRCRPGC